MANLETILSWFQAGDYPTQEEFEQTFSSFRHKDTKIPITEVDGLESSLNNKLNVDDLPSNMALVDEGQPSDVFNKEQIMAMAMMLSDYVKDGKIRADKIEALGLTDLIESNERNIAEFAANSGKYEFQQNDFIAVPDDKGNFSLFIFKGEEKSDTKNYLPTGLTNITMGMVEGLQSALNTKLDKPAVNGNYFVKMNGTASYQSINPGSDHLLFWNGSEFKNSNIFRENSGLKYGIGTTTPAEQLHLTSRARMSGLVLENNTETLPQQLTYSSKKFFGTDDAGVKRPLMFADYGGFLNLVNTLSQSQKDAIGSTWNAQYSNGALNVYSITPTVIKNDHVVRYLILQGLNLNVSPLSTTVKFIPVGNALGSGEIDCLGFQTFADGKTMIVSIYGDALPAGIQYNIVIRTTSPIVQTHRTTSFVNVASSINNIDISNINWTKLAYTAGQENNIFTTNGGLFSYSSSSNNKAYAYEPNTFVGAIKSGLIFPANTNFYLEMNVSLSFNTGGSSDVFDFYAYLGLLQNSIPLSLSDNTFLRLISSTFRSGAYYSPAMWNNLITGDNKIEPGSTTSMNANVIIMRQGNIYTQVLTVGAGALVQSITSSTEAISISLAVTNGSTLKSFNGSIVQAFTF